MVSRSDRDTVTGGAVVLGGVFLLMLAFAIGGKSDDAGDGYVLKARFNRADGISIGSPVRLSGTVVGRVVGQSLDDRYRALLTLHLRKDIALTSDTAAVIYTDGLLEARQADEIFGSARVVQTLAEGIGMPLEARIAFLTERARRYDSGNLRDDVSVLAVQRMTTPPR